MRRVVLLLTVMAATLVVASGVALAVTKIGTDGPNTLRGTNGADNLIGKGGNDDLFGLGGRITCWAERARTTCWPATSGAWGGATRPWWRSWQRFVLGGKGSENIVGGEGNDFLVEYCLREFSKDTLSGGSGNDVIDVWHKPAAVKDVVACGSGFDRVIADRATLVAPDCEKVVVVHGSLEDSFQQQIDSSRPSRRASSKVCRLPRSGN